jgi:hypothetical protein
MRLLLPPYAQMFNLWIVKTEGLTVPAEKTLAIVT